MTAPSRPSFCHYRLLDRLGRGGMGIVYKALDTRLHRYVAIKLLPGDLISDPECRLRFEREARAAAALQHPNICTIHEVGEVPPDIEPSAESVEMAVAAGTPFIAMEYLEGVTLRSLLDQGRPPFDRAVSIAIQLAEALAHSQRNGVVHRDLKPENVMVGPDGRVKVLDFGLAKPLRESAPSDPVAVADQETLTGMRTDVGRIVGTAAYMSPEQARGHAVDSRSDLFSLGIIVYEMFTGVRPFIGGTPIDTLSAILRERPAPPATLNSALPPTLERIILRCLEKEPRDRYQRCEDLLADLEGVRPPAPHAGIDAPRRRGVLPRGASPIVGLALLTALVLVVWLNPGDLRTRLTGISTSPPIKAVAVLPFENLSGDAGQEYFADGMTETLIADLARIQTLQVTSRTSVMRFKGARERPRDIAGELHVEALVAGSVVADKGRARVTAQLIEASSERVIWADAYDRDSSSILDVQSEMAHAIAREIHTNLTPQQEARLRRDRSIDPESYRLYLMGRYFWNKRTKEALERSLDLFREAIDKDPGFALAHAGLADAYFALGSWTFLPARDAYPKAKSAAIDALRLDDSLAEAHASLAAVMMDYDLDLAGAEAEFRRAIELNPSYATAHQWYAISLAARGRHEEAIPEIRRAQQLDPLSLVIGANVGRHYYFARRYDEAIAECRRTLSMDAGFSPAHYFLGMAYVQEQMYAEAVAEFKQALGPSGGGGSIIAALGYAYARSGQVEKATELLGQLRRPPAQGGGSPAQIALIQVALGQREEALASLEQAFRESPGDLFFLKIDPWFDALRSEPRFQELLRRIGLDS